MRRWTQHRLLIRWLAVAFLLALTAPNAEGRADDLTLRDGGPSATALLEPTDFAGLAFFRPVLTGVLYRAGFKGGDKEHDGLSQAQRAALCAAGFSAARYIDFGSRTQFGVSSCAEGELDYEAGRSDSAAAVLAAVYDVIRTPGKGPVLLHCMWGVHASGAVAAMALVQFCGWSEVAAKAYWNAARNGAGCGGGCDAWIDEKFSHFSANPALVLTAAERSAICPQEP